MEILAIRSAPPGGSTIARFDVQLEGMRLFNLALKHGPSGHRVYAPSAFGMPAASFTADTAAALIRAALREMANNDNRQQAA